MKKRLLSMLMVLAMALTFMPPSAMALVAEHSSATRDVGDGENWEVFTDEINYSPAVTSADLELIPSMYAGRYPAKAEGAHEKWIDRYKLESYAVEFYNALKSGASENGILVADSSYRYETSGDKFIDMAADDWNDTVPPKVAKLKTGDVVTIKSRDTDSKTDSDTNEVTKTTTVSTYSAIYVTDCTPDDFYYVSNNISVAFYAFDRDCPEVFWLDGSISTPAFGFSGKYYVFFKLKGTDQITTTVDDGTPTTTTKEMDLRAAKYQTGGETQIESDIRARNTAVSQIVTNELRNKKPYEQIVAFNEKLVQQNDYNTPAANKTDTSGGNLPWECISALDAGAGSSIDPVCEGYARAFKVLCDEVGIPCVLVDGRAFNGQDAEAHMWNYVQVDGKWYAVDVTWNDPTGGAQTEATKVKWLLLGSDTVVIDPPQDVTWTYGDGSQETVTYSTFISTHPVANAPSTDAMLVYDNGPALNADRCPAPLTGTVIISGNAVFGSELTADVSVTNADFVTGTDTLTYQWYRGEGETKTAIPSATNDKYTVAKDDIGQPLTVEVSCAKYSDKLSATTEAPAEAATVSVTVSISPSEIICGGTAAATATVTATNGDKASAEDKTVTGKVVYSSSNTSVATVDASTGAITAGQTAGTATITATFTADGYTTASGTADVTVSALTIKSIAVNTQPTKITYEHGDTFDGTGLILTVTYSDDSTENIAYADGNMEFNPTSLTKGTTSVTGTYLGETFNISGITVTAKDLSAATVTVATGSVYNGSEQKPAVTVTLDGKTLEAGDYEVTYTGNTNAGENTATATVTGKENYTGTVTKTFSIAKATPTLSDISVTGTVYTTTDPTKVTVTGTAKVGETVLTGGTWALKDVTEFTTAGENQEYDVVFTPSETDQANCNSAYDKVTFDVLERTVHHITVSGTPKVSYTHGENFDPTGLTVKAFYTENTEDDEEGEIVNLTQVTFNEGKPLTAGQTTVEAKYKEKTATINGITVNKIQLEVDTAYVNTFVFDGENHTVKLTNALPTGVEVDYTGDVTKMNASGDTDYTATATFSLATGYDTAYYEIVNKADKTALSTLAMSWSITQKAGGSHTVTKTVKNDVKTAQTIDLSSYIPANCGRITDPVSVTLGGASTIIAASPSVDTTAKTLTFSLADGDIAADQSATLTMTITTQNYTDITVTVTVTTTNKISPNLTADPITKTYDGTAVTLDRINKSAVDDDGKTIEGTWSYGGSDLSVQNVSESGAYTLQFAPTDGTTYANNEISVTITINKATATVTANSYTITVGESLPEYACTIPAGVTLSPAPTVSCAAEDSATAGTYTITVTGPATSTDGNYSIVYVPGTLTVQAATPATIPVTGVTMSPSTLTLTAGGTGTLTAAVSPANATNQVVTWTSSDPAVATVSGGTVTAVGAGTATITVTTADGNYTATCTVTVSASGIPDIPVYPDYPIYPSNPSTPSTPSTPNTPSETPVVPGSPVVTPSAPVSNGTAEAVVSKDMADQLVEQAASGSDTVVIAPVVTGSASQTEVTIPASAVSGIAGSSNAELRVETPAADITIPNSALTDLGRQGGSVVVTAGESNGIVSIEITANGKTVDQVPGGVKAEIPVSCTPGTVAMVIDENGELTPVRKSYADDSGRTMTVPLEGSAQMVFVDNSKSFDDVTSTSWAADAVAFASSRELMNGVDSDSFSPNTSMTRGMLAVVLHNLEGNPSASYSGSFSDVTGSAWYAEAVQWAADNSIIGGIGDGSFAPNAPITREQLVVMLYRYAGQPTASGSLGRFSDAGSVSGWAQQAMAWAVANGIIKGSNGALNPQSSATRAEVAQMLMNFVTSGVL